MMLFWFLSAALVVAGLLLILPSLLGRGKGEGIARRELNVALFQDRMEELERELDEGTLSPEQFEQTRNELRRDLIANTESQPPSGQQRAPRWAVWVVGIGLPVAAFSIYFALGAADLIDQAPHVPRSAAGAGPGADAAAAGDMAAMADRLVARLEENPEDAEGWMLLGRTYSFLQRHTDAADAYAKARGLTGDPADLILMEARSRAMAQGGSLEGAPAELVAKALAAEPEHPEALWLHGLIAFQQEGYDEAIGTWKGLLARFEPNSEAAQAINENIARAEALRDGSGAPVLSPDKSAAGAGLTVEVNVAPEVAERIGADDTVFVFARAPEGPRMPIAAQRLKGSDLPATVTLDDSSSMTGQALSSFDEVVIVARVTKSGGVQGQSGDLEGEAVSPSSGHIAVSIDKVIP